MNSKIEVPKPLDSKKLTLGQKLFMFLGLTAAAGTLVGLAHSGEPKPSKLPTVVEYNADPSKYPDYKQITIQPGAGYDDVAKEYLPDIDVKSASQAVKNEDHQNALQGSGHDGLEQSEAFIVPIGSEKSQN